MYETSLCPDCSQPKHRAYNPDMDGWYDVEEDVCYGCGAVEQHAGSKEVKASHKLYVVDTGPAELRDLSPS